MDKYLASFIGISFIFVMTTAGSALVFFFKKDLSKRIKELLLGLASGVMMAASIWSLLIPALESNKNTISNYIIISCTFILGGLFMYLIDRILPLVKLSKSEDGLKNKSVLSKTSKMFLAVTIHNIPEGLSVGLAFGSVLAIADSTDQIALIYSALGLALGIGIQNFPEGAAVSLPIKAETKSSLKAFLYGTLSGAVEPIAAILGILLASTLSVVMPFALSFAAGSMIYVVIDELIPSSSSEESHFGTFGAMIGFAIMMLLDVPFMTRGMKQKYTDESVKSYYKKAGVCYVIMAVGAVLESVAKSGTVLHDAGWVLFIAGVIIPMFLSKGLQSK